MAEITLSDYVGYIFSEIVRARDLADRESKRIAEIYAKDDVLRSFSVPRFKIPELDLTIPVLISGAKFTNTVSFTMSKEDFASYINGRLSYVVRSILIKRRTLNFTGNFQPIDTNLILNRPITRRGANSEESSNEFYEQLKTNDDPLQPEAIIQDKWYEIFFQKLQETNLKDDFTKYYPNNELYTQTLAEITEKIKANTVISASKIKNLLVNPETNVVKNGSSDASVFVVKAKITEEGLFVRTVKDSETGTEKQITEFE